MRKGSKSFALSILMALLALSVALPLPADARCKRLARYATNAAPLRA